MNTDYSRIARTDDEPIDDEGEWVAQRRGDIFRAWVNDRARLKSSIEDALADDDNGTFASALADLFLKVDARSSPGVDAEAAGTLWHDLKHLVFHSLRRDAETAAQAEWDAMPRRAPE